MKALGMRSVEVGSRLVEVGKESRQIRLRDEGATRCIGTLKRWAYIPSLPTQIRKSGYSRHPFIILTTADSDFSTSTHYPSLSLLFSSPLGRERDRFVSGLWRRSTRSRPCVKDAKETVFADRVE